MIVILGTPRTKKNSPRIFKNRRTGARFVMPSAASSSWTESAVAQIQAQWQIAPLAVPLQLRAAVYRARKVGDLGNYLAAICDALETARAIENDKWIVSFDGSRLREDKTNPRVEIELFYFIE